ncbi:MAG: hypothetical protein HQ594_06155 [Candidatus Omnitrophica bacterium]|nr:hypothetical protein [Candidatus Omnitrophota bacterium]
MHRFKTSSETADKIKESFAELETAIRTGKAEPELINLSVRLDGVDAVMWRTLMRFCNFGTQAKITKNMMGIGIGTSFNMIFAEAFQKFLKEKD